ncbi:hypothetical protein [Eubacterium sp.]|uniref:hypothetical protein n=1 Tax=Eubacterium sp. TaxID=142586 RepID=UPI0025E4DB35|nr:hypothetical protein [Eubacterium sp.]MCR5629166.1 hypothetical protein [Eubacterium sp.]
MNSKTLFTKKKINKGSFKFDLKRDFYMYVLYQIFFFFLLCFYVTILDPDKSRSWWDSSGRRVTFEYASVVFTKIKGLSNWYEYLCFEDLFDLFASGTVKLFLMLIAGIETVRGYTYLNDKSKVDFYFSRPESRTSQFISRLIRSFIIVIGAYTIAQILGLVVCGVKFGGKFVPVVFVNLIPVYLLNIYYYLVIYLLSAIAVFLAGTGFTALVNIFTVHIGPLIFSVSLAILERFGKEESILESLIIRITKSLENIIGIIVTLFPFTDFVMYGSGAHEKVTKYHLRNIPSDGSIEGCKIATNSYRNITDITDINVPCRILIYVGLIILFLSIAIKIYNMRKTERAGEAYTFNIVMFPMELFVVSMVGIYSMGFFGGITRTNISGISVICGLIISAVAYGFIEFIYYGDIKGGFKGKGLSRLLIISLCWVILAVCFTV